MLTSNDYLSSNPTLQPAIDKTFTKYHWHLLFISMQFKSSFKMCQKLTKKNKFKECRNVRNVRKKEPLRYWQMQLSTQNLDFLFLEQNELSLFFFVKKPWTDSAPLWCGHKQLGRPRGRLGE